MQRENLSMSNSGNDSERRLSLPLETKKSIFKKLG
jgi:hypothetical protein